MLLDLSNELLTLIVDLLEAQELLFVQLACRHLYLVSLPIAASRYFQVITTDLSRASIERLQRLLENKTYRQAVREIRLTAEKYGEGWCWVRNDAGILQWDAEDATIVRTTLSQFPVCTSLAMERDGMSDLVPSYGVSDTYLTTADVMTLVFSWLSISQQPIRNVSLNLDGKVPKHALILVNSQSYASDGFWASWSKLKVLSLRVPLDYEGRDAQVAADLASKATNLEHLELQDTTRSSAGRPLLEYMIRRNHFPALTHLKLRGLYAISTPVLATLLKHVENSLSNLRFDYITIDGDWKEILLGLQKGFPKLRCLALAHLKKQGTSLVNSTRIFFCAIRHLHTQDEFTFVENVDRITKRQFCISGVRYQGENTHRMLGCISDALYLEGQPPTDLLPYQPRPARSRIRVFEARKDEGGNFKIDH